MYMISVSSKNLKYVGYDEPSKTLRIQFINGTYDYYNVPKNIYHGLITTSSHNDYFIEYVKGKFDYSRV